MNATASNSKSPRKVHAFAYESFGSFWNVVLIQMQGYVQQITQRVGNFEPVSKSLTASEASREVAKHESEGHARSAELERFYA